VGLLDGADVGLLGLTEGFCVGLMGEILGRVVGLLVGLNIGTTELGCFEFTANDGIDEGSLTGVFDDLIVGLESVELYAQRS